LYRLCVIALLVAACKGPPPEGRTAEDTLLTFPDVKETGEGEDTGPLPGVVEVRVTLDDAATAGILVMEGGGSESWLTDADGKVLLAFDATIPGRRGITASHPEARVGFVGAEDGELAYTIELERFDPSDNEAYLFEDPGTPTDLDDTSKCAHCHRTINEDWYGSAHREATSNAVVQDVYAGTAAALTSDADCSAAGGRWWSGLEPGTRAPIDRCYLGDGALPDINDNCGDTASCDESAIAFGACADCHSPGIDGVLGGRDLLEATGFAWDYGVHCDVCHKVESVDMSQPAGVAGRLHVVRPLEEPESLVAGPWLPLTFGPYFDVGNPRMGSVQRDHFSTAEFCGGCHQLDQPVLVPGVAVDLARWPDGTLPIHSTYAEWEAGPMNPAAPCASCHMPADAEVGNAADLYNFITLTPDVVTGWPRDPGAVRQHTWVGPRYVDSPMLGLAASVDIAKSVDAAELTASITVKNVGPGHAIPTGEPLRSLVVLVRAECDAVPLVPSGGDAVPDFGGALDRQDAAGDWSVWPGAVVGDAIRVISRPGGHYDYPGFGPFGDGTFDPLAKGMPVEHVVGESVVTAVVGDVVTLDQPLPAGDIAYRAPGGPWPVDGAVASGWAGSPGFAFARVVTDRNGRRMVPHHAAVDVASDNRILPQQTWTSTHQFTSPCPDPEVSAVLLHRAWPLEMARVKGWSLTDSVMAEAVR